MGRREAGAPDNAWRKRTKMGKFRVGVIGCGRISTTYRDVFDQLSDQIEVCIAVDKVPMRAQAFSNHFSGCAWSDQMSDLLGMELDAVHILTPHFLHAEHACACLEAGIHVLTEKPIATTLHDADLMINAAKKADRQLAVIFQNRYIEGIQEAKTLIENGAFGKLTGAWSSLTWHRPPSYYACDWKGSWEREGGGVVIDQAIHSLDLVRWLMNSPFTDVSAHIDRRVLTSIEVEDVADAAIRFENGAIYSFFATNYFTGNSPIRIEISGEKGSLLLVENKVTFTLKDRERYTIAPPIHKQLEGESYWGNYHLAQVSAFYEDLRQGNSTQVGPEDARETLRLVLSIYEASRESGTVYPADR